MSPLWYIIIDNKYYWFVNKYDCVNVDCLKIVLGIVHRINQWIPNKTLELTPPTIAVIARAIITNTSRLYFFLTLNQCINMNEIKKKKLYL